MLLSASYVRNSCIFPAHLDGKQASERVGRTEGRKDAGRLFCANDLSPFLLLHTRKRHPSLICLSIRIYAQTTNAAEKEGGGEGTEGSRKDRGRKRELFYCLIVNKKKKPPSLFSYISFFLSFFQALPDGPENPRPSSSTRRRKERKKESKACGKPLSHTYRLTLFTSHRMNTFKLNFLISIFNTLHSRCNCNTYFKVSF